MGTWGSDNISSDEAYDMIDDRSAERLTAWFDLARGPLSREADETAYSRLWLGFEELAALRERGLLRMYACPPVPEIGELRDDYLRDWERYISALKPGPGFVEQRRAVIVASFDALARWKTQGD